MGDMRATASSRSGSTPRCGRSCGEGGPRRGTGHEMLTSKWTWGLVLPLLVPAALVLGLLLLPAVLFAYATYRPAVHAGNALVPVAYGILLAAVVAASIAWPF